MQLVFGSASSASARSVRSNQFSQMDRRDFLGKAVMAGVALAAAPAALNAAPFSAPQGRPEIPMKIIKDETRDGVRYVTATPSSKVCSKQIDVEIDVKTRTICAAKFTRGCDGNAKGLCMLLKGMKVDEVVKRLDGVNCAGRGTSCPDQMAQVLKSLKW